LKPFKRVLKETKISLQYHNELNPSLFRDNRLDPDIKSRLLEIGGMFADFCRVPRHYIKDVIMTGGNANYNYTDKSDIDVHIVISKDALGMSRDWLDDYLSDKKSLWSIKYGITVHGYPIELYVQDASEVTPAGQGVYSLVTGTWVQQPTHQEISFNDPHLKKKVLSYVHQINWMMRNDASYNAFKDLRTKLKDMRGAAIAKGGEFSFENLVFKELRNRGYLDKINNYMKLMKDKELSI